MTIRGRSLSRFGKCLTNQTLYLMSVRPEVLAAAAPWSAAMMKCLHPMRTSRISGRTSFRCGCSRSPKAEQVRRCRVFVSEDGLPRKVEETFGADLTITKEICGRWRRMSRESAILIEEAEFSVQQKVSDRGRNWRL